MPIMIWLSLFFVAFNICSGSPLVNQPQSTSVPLGQNIQITCTGNNIHAYRQQWLQQQPGKAPKLIMYSGATRPAGISERYSGSVTGNTAVLSIAKAQAEDEAVYFCLLWWDGTYYWVFGGGTELTVTGQPTVSPSVQVFAPSPEEIRSPNPHTVVCFVNDFHPRSFNLQWKCDDKVMTSGVDTTKAIKQGDNYFANSYMKLSASAYENCDIFTCTVTHEGKTIAKSVSKSGSC